MLKLKPVPKDIAFYKGLWNALVLSALIYGGALLCWYLW